MALGPDEIFMWELIDEVLFEEILDVHYAYKKGTLNLDDLFGLEPLKPPCVNASLAQNGIVNGGGSSSSGGIGSVGVGVGALVGPKGAKVFKAAKAQPPAKAAHFSMTVQCPLCLASISGSRFAPHLEKCMNGGKRGSLSNRKHDSLDVVHVKKDKVVFTDPFPESTVIRIKMRNGLPRVTAVREGASLEEFLALSVPRPQDADGARPD